MSENHMATTGQSVDERSAYWQAHIEAWRASGLSARRFCSENGLPYGRFRYWSSKQRNGGEAQKRQSRFARVVSVGGPVSTGLTITLPGGVQIGGIDADNIGLLPQVIARL